MSSLFITSESVTEGHPDKLADQIADAILDEILKKDPEARVAIESLITRGLVLIAGEITTSTYVEIQKIARDVIREVGYDNPLYGFDAAGCGVTVSLQEQSPDIARGVSRGKLEDIGAGDQGCLKEGTLIRTKRGFVPIEEVEVGDFVVTPHGFKRVLVSRMTGEKETIELSYTNGMSLECTPDHRILCYDRRGFTYWKAAGDLVGGEFICATKPQKNFVANFYTSVVARSRFFSKYNHKIFGPEEIVLNEETGYLVGELVGDGYIKDRRLMDLAFGTNNNGHAVFVQKIANRQMPHQWRLIKNSGGISLKIDSVLVREHFRNFGLGYIKAQEKETPDAIFAASTDVIKSYLRGLFDSDGTIITKTGRKKNNIRIRLCSSSLKLLRETQLLLNDFSIKSSILFNMRKNAPVGKRGSGGKIYRSNYDNYVLSFVGFESYKIFGEEIGFGDSKKKKKLAEYLMKNRIKPKNSRGIFLVPHPTKNEMVEEEKIGLKLPFFIIGFKRKTHKKKIVKVYDLEVEDVHIFSANGIFVHNSMYGYATDETPELLPFPIMLAHRLTKRLAQVRKKRVLRYLRPDGKSQVTVEYENAKPKRIVNVLVSSQHDPDISYKTLKKDIIEKVILPSLPKHLVDADTEIFVNPTGRFVFGGPQADTGVSGRKIIVDTYGGVVPHGGGSFSGKDPTKVDRTGAYAARWVAVNIVSAGLAKKAEVQLAYSIGISRPLSLNINSFGTGKIPDEKLRDIVQNVFDLRPGMIIKQLGLRRPIYRQLASYGHFGRPELKLPWERTDKAKMLRKAIKEF